MDGIDEVFERQRPRLVALAYRMLGSRQDAEDLVQDAYFRWVRAEGVEHPEAWLAKVVSNLCLNELGSARVRRESYTGPWLPEPVFTDDDPVELRDTVSYALLTLMERLTPAERAVFVLKEAFGYSHREIAEFLDLTDANTRQLHSRARRRLGDRARFTPSAEEQKRLVERFLGAALEGDMTGLTSLFAADVTAWADGGGRVRAALRPIAGRAKVLRYVLGILRQLEDAELVVTELNGEVALAALRDGELFTVTLVEFGAEGVAGLRTVLNPEKLRLLGRRLSHS
ncbi:RNA polymerase sigma factor SigJ [Actinocorallia populi]|uniref:RNA polymerase sigma factor SigJ n=1 Tax=Actinocorallia populi TaxID=2079200 RepID=UPI0018E50853|nr:RNA polymerase sigma factor SigJ [Actinocorallia populi]